MDFLFQENSMHMAARRGNLDEVRRLVDKGADVSIKDINGVSK